MSMSALISSISKQLSTRPFACAGDVVQAVQAWIVACQQQLQSNKSQLSLLLPPFVRNRPNLLKWVFDYFLDIHQIETWVITEVRRRTPFGQALLKMTNKDVFHHVVLSSFQKGLHAETQLLLNLQGRVLSRAPYIAFSFPACAHCQLFYSTVTVALQTGPAHCRIWGSSGMVFPWPASDCHLTDSVKSAFLGTDLYAQYSTFHGRLAWESAVKGRTAPQVFEVKDQATFARWLATEGIKTLEDWLLNNGAVRTAQGSLSRHHHA